MATDQATARALITKTPDVCGGDACIAGRRIPVWQLVESRRQGTSDETLLEIFAPPLTREELKAAWQYYEGNRQEIEEALRENELAMTEPLDEN